MTIAEVTVLAQGSATTSWVDAPLSRVVPETDSARFSSLLGNPPPLAGAAAAPGPGPGPAPAGVPPAPPAQLITRVSGISGIGDAILESLKAAGQHYTDAHASVRKVLEVDGGSLSMGDALRVQFHLIDISLQTELLSKGISKAVQHVDQLTKLQ